MVSVRPLAVRGLVGLVIVEQVRWRTVLAGLLQHEDALEADLVVDDETAVIEVERIGSAVVLADERSSLDGARQR